MLEHLFGSKTRVNLLRIFFRNSGKNFYVRELSRAIKTQLNAVRREVANLEKLRIIEHVPKEEVKKDKLGTENSKFYRLKMDSLLYVELDALLSKIQIIEEQELIEDFKNKTGDLKLLLLTGVFTNTSDTATDMLIVGNTKPLVTNRLIKQFEDVLNCEVRYTIMTDQEFKERKEIGDKFLYNLFEANHIMVVDKMKL